MNLLPWRERRRRRRLRVFAGGVAAAALVGAIAVAWPARVFEQRVTELRAVGAELRTQVAGLDADLVAADSLAAATREIEHRAARLADLECQRGIAVAVLEALAAAATDGVRLTRVALDKAIVTVEGEAVSPAHVSTLLDALRAGGGFGTPALRAIGQADAVHGPGGAAFSLSLPLAGQG